MYATVEHTKYHAYVAHPSRTGLHNYGMAVDLTICKAGSVPLDMGTPFDFFGKAAGINRENELVAQGILTKQQVDNRLLLRRIMTEAGFIPIRGEWWHFNAMPLNTARKTVKVIE
jgi:D-alanyl-D-alanine dipeptidase